MYQHLLSRFFLIRFDYGKTISRIITIQLNCSTITLFRYFPVVREVIISVSQ